MKTTNAVVFVHGGGVTRHEGGFYTRLATSLADVGIPSLRFDIRGHGESEGKQEDLTISGITNDIRSAVERIRAETGDRQLNVIGASFGGGISAFYASSYSSQVNRLAFVNPLLNYKKRFIDDKPYWHNDRISLDEGEVLASEGFVRHSPTFRLGRALLNEVFYVQPHRALSQVRAPTLIIHGTSDTFVPIESSRQAIADFGGKARLVEIDGAQHGIAVSDDPQYQNPQTLEWQAYAARAITEWFTET